MTALPTLTQYIFHGCLWFINKIKSNKNLKNFKQVYYPVYRLDFFKFSNFHTSHTRNWCYFS